MTRAWDFELLLQRWSALSLSG